MVNRYRMDGNVQEDLMESEEFENNFLYENPLKDYIETDPSMAAM